MAGIAICENKDCIHKDKCFRFISKVGEVCNFAKICNKENKYKWLWEVEMSIAKK